jgi:aldose 1-epimerase
MAGGVEDFGTDPEGAAVGRISISGGGLRASMLNWGAVVQELWLDGHDRPLTLGFERLEDYLQHTVFYGAMVGRYANRIAHGRFIIDGERFETDRNDRGHTLHGGSRGIDRRVWDIAEHGADFVTLTLRDPDGAMGFPGNLDISCTYRLRPPGTLAIELSATTDRPTLCNLAHHSWFNLDDGGAGDILGHRMIIPAAAYLSTDGECIPTGEVLPVEGTQFDFRRARTIRAPEGVPSIDYDHNFCLAASRRPLSQMAWVQGARSGVEMEVWSTEPGLQFFSGNTTPRDVPGLRGIRYGRYAGICLEPQVWPDSPNRPYFPQAVLRPGEEYRQSTEYRFRIV